MQLVALERLPAIERAAEILIDLAFLRGTKAPLKGELAAARLTERWMQIWYDLSVSASPSHLPWEGRLCVVYFLISSQYRLAACSVLLSP